MPGSEAIDNSKIVDETVRRIDQGGRRIALVGAPSSGKTTALAAVAENLASKGWATFHTSMPNGDDAGPLALTLLADQVGSGKVIRDAATPWATKLAATVAATRQRAQGASVLVLAPLVSSWGASLSSCQPPCNEPGSVTANPRATSGRFHCHGACNVTPCSAPCGRPRSALS